MSFLCFLAQLSPPATKHLNITACSKYCDGQVQQVFWDWIETKLVDHFVHCQDHHHHRNKKGLTCGACHSWGKCHHGITVINSRLIWVAWQSDLAVFIDWEHCVLYFQNKRRKKRSRDCRRDHHCPRTIWFCYNFVHTFHFGETKNGW